MELYGAPNDLKGHHHARHDLAHSDTAHPCVTPVRFVQQLTQSNVTSSILKRAYIKQDELIRHK
jgi:hypothetical protein